MQTKQFLGERSILLRWIFFGSYGLTIGLLVASMLMAISNVIVIKLIHLEDLGIYIFGGVTGAFLGFFQSVALKHHFARPSLWMLASAIGLMIGVASMFYLELNYNVLETTTSSLLMGALIGLAIGFAQWLILRLHVLNSGLWIAGSLIGAALSALIINPLMLLVDKFDSLVGNDVGIIFGIFQLVLELLFVLLFVPFIIGFVYNLTTGIIINWLLNNSAKEAESQGS